MNIGIDARPVGRPASRRRGIGMYTRCLCAALAAHNRALGAPHQFISAVSRGAGPAAEGWRQQVLPAIRRPSRMQWMLDLWALPRFLSDCGIEVFHATEVTSVPRSARCRILAHVHDMIPFLFWKEYAARIPCDFRWALQRARRALRHADRIITDSESSRRDIAALTGYPAERIHVAYFGPAGTGAVAAADPPGDAAGHPFPGHPYFLYVGGTDFRKNVPFLARAFGAFAREHPDVRLVLAGETFSNPRLPEVAEVFEALRRGGGLERTWTAGFVEDSRLRALYRGAVALVFPSLYEGFGLPVLEAMTLGAPVVAARTSSVPEILGDTGIYFDPLEQDSLVEALRIVYDSPSLRRDLSARAAERARGFSWENTAQVIFRLYGELQ